MNYSFSNNDPLWKVRHRFHQAWYRLNVLKLNEFGYRPEYEKKYPGDWLSKIDGINGLNFLFEPSLAQIRERATRGWGISPVSYFSMISSQAAAFNIFGPIIDDHQLCLHVFSQIYPHRRLLKLVSVEFEFGGLQIYKLSGNRTLVDVIFIFETNEGIMPICVEVKYLDGYSSRFSPMNIETTDLEFNAYLSRRANDFDELPKVANSHQLFRVANTGFLTRRIKMVNQTWLDPEVLVLEVPDHIAAGKTADEISKLFTHERFTRYKLSELLHLFRNSGSTKASVLISEEIYCRYLNFDLSENDWTKWLTQRKTAYSFKTRD